MYIQLTLDQIRDLHEFVLQQHGGLPGEKEPGLIEMMVEKPFTGYDDYEYYPGLFCKAAVYLEGFATKQLFNDGNKRTALMCALTFLELNGYELTVDWQQLYQLTLDVANKVINLNQLTALFEANSRIFGEN